MTSSYDKKKREFTCNFTRDEYSSLQFLVAAGICECNLTQPFANLTRYRKLRDDILEGIAAIDGEGKEVQL